MTTLVRLFTGDRNPEKTGAPIFANTGGHKRRGTQLVGVNFPVPVFWVSEIFILPNIVFWWRFILRLRP